MNVSGAAQAVATMYAQSSARATLLASRTEAAREPLEFAALLCDAQARLAIALDRCAVPGALSGALSGRLSEDARKLAPFQEQFLQVVAERGPEVLAVAATSRLNDDVSTACNRLQVYWRGEATARDDYLSRALLQPYAAVLRAWGITPDHLHNRGHCPFCGSKPWISVRKAISAADGGLCFLGCALCGLEWNFNRVRCTSCFEEDPHKLPVFQSDLHPFVRIEACETCHRYVKSIDLTQDLRPVPAIDDLVSLSMDLWAIDGGFTRIEPGLAGI